MTDDEKTCPCCGAPAEAVDGALVCSVAWCGFGCGIGCGCGVEPVPWMSTWHNKPGQAHALCAREDHRSISVRCDGD